MRATRHATNLTLSRPSITVVSSIRLRSLIGFAQAFPQNPTSKHNRVHHQLRPARSELTRPSTVDFFGVALWSALELTTGVTVACLPATRQVVVKYVPILPDIISRYTSRLTSTLSYVSGGTKSAGKTSELGKSNKSTDISKDRTLQRIPTEDAIIMKALPPAPPPPRTPRSPGDARPYSVATTPSSLADGFSLGVFEGGAGSSADDVSNAGNDPEQGRPAVSPGGPLGPNATRPWRPISYPQPRTDRPRW